jgi:osmotically-inducible protein OsmY
VSIKCDNAIKHNVEAELRCCSTLDQTDIAVKVNGGIVTLTGYVANFLHKDRAEDAVKRVAGVVAIANDIQVQASATFSDPEIAREAVAAIKRQLPLNWEQVRPTVRHGSVTLEGLVDANYQREEAEKAVSTVTGVVCVVNAIGLAPGAHAVRREDVKGLIEDSFRRAGQRDASDISVDADGTAVTLRGRVRSWNDRSQAERSAWSALAVQSVRNELKVQFEESDALMGSLDTH